MSHAAKDCPRLSVAMIVRNAEECLGPALDSVRNLADEIVVVDTGSHDSTVRIARQKATKVVTHNWTDDFSAARNAALVAVTGDWVLWLDAGETITAQTAEALRRFIDHEADDQTAYFLLVHTPAQGANIAGEQVARLRLHPRKEGLAWKGRIRESLDASAREKKLKTAGLPFAIHRGIQDLNPEIRGRRAQRNLALAKLEIGETGPTPNLLNCLGEAAQALGDYASSVRFYREALEKSEPGSTSMLEAYYGLLTALEGEPNSRDAQLQLCMKALETFPLDAQLLCAIGGYLQSKELYELASRAYQVSAQHGQLNLEIWHLEGIQEIAMNCYAGTLQHLGRESEAIELLTQELTTHPEWSRLRRQLLEIHVRGGRREEALDVVNAMPREISNREALRSAVRGACLTAEGNWVTGKTYLEDAYKAGCREPLCLRWLTQAYLQSRQIDDAARVLDQWTKVDPLSPELRQAKRALQDLQTPSFPAPHISGVRAGTRDHSPV